MNVSITSLNIQAYAYHGHKTHFMIIAMVQTRSAVISCIDHAGTGARTNALTRYVIIGSHCHELALFFCAVIVLTVYRSHVQQAWKHDPLIDGETKTVSLESAASSRVGRAVAVM